ncbi:MAG: DUF4340 domain-containing protein [Chloroflexi bacterium]|nr:DUF4340 domain-containing protein [Chloroflexota bacterium]
MNYKLTLGLLGVLLVIGAYVYLSEVQPGEKKKDTPTQVLSIKAGDVTSITVSYQDKTTELKKDGSYWKLSKPEEAETQNGVVDGLLARIAPLNASRSLAGTDEPLASYGLENPQLEATLVSTDNKTAILQVGDDTPDGSSSYVKLKDSDQVYVVGASVISELRKLVTNPPKALPTPTPTPRPIGTAVPTPTATPTP